MAPICNVAWKKNCATREGYLKKKKKITALQLIDPRDIRVSAVAVDYYCSSIHSKAKCPWSDVTKVWNTPLPLHEKKIFIVIKKQIFSTVMLFNLHAVTFASLRLHGPADCQSGRFTVIKDPIWREIHFTMFSNSKMHLSHVSKLPRDEKSPVPLVAALLLAPSKRVGGPQQSWFWQEAKIQCFFWDVVFWRSRLLFFLNKKNCSRLLHRSWGLKIKIW